MNSTGFTAKISDCMIFISQHIEIVTKFYRKSDEFHFLFFFFQCCFPHRTAHHLVIGQSISGTVLNNTNIYSNYGTGSTFRFNGPGSLFFDKCCAVIKQELHTKFLFRFFFILFCFVFFFLSLTKLIIIYYQTFSFLLCLYFMVFLFFVHLFHGNS